MMKQDKSKLQTLIKAVRFRFWIESGMAALTSTLFIVTLLKKDWIEAIFEVEPDGGNGELEWLLVAALFAVTVVLFRLARYEWRSVREAIGQP